MTDKTLHIVPYISDHGRLIMQSQMNHVLMQKDMSYRKASMDLEEKDLAFSGFINNNLIASAGMKLLWGGVAEGWVMATQDVWRHPIVIARAIKKNFEVLAKNNKIKRVQTAVRADFDIGLKFAKWLGLKNEGMMEYYGIDGSHHYRYARIF